MNPRLTLMSGVAIVSLMVGTPTPFLATAFAQVSQANVTVTVDVLRERIAPQGEFVKIATVGEVWKPRGLPQDWKPYSRGNWIYNEKVGWYFNSDEPFAEVTYHYGRWYEDPDQGWVWVADTKWAPAWVEWRRNKQYVGWRPLPPDNAPRRAGRRGGTAVIIADRRGAPDYVEEEWVFVPSTQILSPRIDTVVIRREQVVEIYTQTEVVGRVEDRGGLYVNLSLQPAFLERDANIQVQSRNLPQAQTVPVPAQVQQISTETRVTIPATAPAAGSVVAPSTSPPSAASPSPATAPAAVTTAPTDPKSGNATAPAASPASPSTSTAAPSKHTGPASATAPAPSPSPAAPATATAPATAPSSPAKPAAAAPAPGAVSPPPASSATAPTSTPAAPKAPNSATAPTAAPHITPSTANAPPKESGQKPPASATAPVSPTPPASVSAPAKEPSQKPPASAAAPGSSQAPTAGNAMAKEPAQKSGASAPESTPPASAERPAKKEE